MSSFDHSLGIASLNIGIGGLSLQLFHIAKRAFSTYTGALSFDDTSAILKAKLVIEESRLSRWGDALGIPDTFTLPDVAEYLQISEIKEKTPLEDASLVLLSSAIQVLLSDLEVLKSRYGLSTAAGPALAAPAGVSTLPPPVTAAIIASQSGTAEMTSWLQRMASLIPSRGKIRWAVTGQERSERLVKELKDINDSLFALLPYPCCKDVGRAVVEELTSTEEWRVLHKFAEAAKSQNASIYTMATAKEVAIRAGSALLSRLSPENLSISPSLIAIDSENPIAVTGTYTSPTGDVRILIEWKKYKGDLKSNPDKFKRLLTRIENIAQALHQDPKPKGFLTLNCLKFFDDSKEDRFGFVFGHPPGSDPLSNPISLRMLYDARKKDKQLLLGERFSLAALISNSVYEFHCANWFHKSINPKNVLFFKKRDGEIDVLSPFLTGFEYSRLDQDSEYTEPPESDYLYRHPDYQTAEDRDTLDETSELKYRREYDIYALGLVLFEIGAWRPLQDFKREDDRHTLRKNLLETYIPRLGVTMGAIYRDVVLACISDKFEVKEGQVVQPKMEFLKEFRWHIVKQLEECKA
ncbi:hypothetical protein FGG08_004261 [Glutinoglossum americanum]|uniref:Protein kinase domain-containing protein n=1 Tax=Glutinoglossum americanum TaxID=1670608 RepID=A0A9P8I2Q6_9PEZI|nr:hypothetical protein FGG08_004261 [Glutinoglossum americanum]